MHNILLLNKCSKKAEKAFSVYRRFKKDFCPRFFVKKDIFWGRDDFLKLPRAFVEGVVLVFLRVVVVLPLWRTWRRKDHECHQHGKNQADAQKDKHKGMARHEIENPGDNSQDHGQREESPTDTKDLLGLFLDKDEESSDGKAQQKKREHSYPLAYRSIHYDWTKVGIRLDGEC